MRSVLASRAPLVAAVLLLLCASAHAQWKVGAAKRSIILLVNGSNDYVVPLPKTDCCSPGTFVQEFDVGNIAVGNGAPDCHWVRDVLYARAIAIGPDPAGKTSLFVSVEVYMLFKNDLQEYYDLMKAAVGEAAYADLLFFVHAQHNHEGPDTSGLNAAPINHDYYRYMLEQMRDASLEALDAREPANLHWGETDFWYGLGDDRDPLIMDGTVRVLRAYRTADVARAEPPLATMVTWAMHPEVTLGYDPIVDPANCTALGEDPSTCTADGRYFTHDYPGWLSSELSEMQGGGEVLYFNGAIGVQIGANGITWEVTPEHPLGNGSVVPEGAENVPEDFHKAFLIGHWLAHYIHTNVVDSQETIPYGEFEYQNIRMLARVTNFFFRVALCPQTALNPRGDPLRPIRIGNTMRKAYVCPEGLQRPRPEDCEEDGYEWYYDDVTRLPYRKGNFMETEASFLRMGNLKLVTIPGELAPELVTGLPKDFDTTEGTATYFGQPEFHATGAAYTLPGTLTSMLECTPDEPCWFWGLTNDQIGYMFPLSDWRILCVSSEENCTALWQKGALAYQDSASGAQCKNITDFPQATKQFYESMWDADTFDIVNATCTYGQTYGEAHDHYEETNSASWDAAALYVNSVAELLGINNPEGRYCDTLCHSLEYVCCQE